MADHPHNKQGFFGPPVPSHFISSETQDSMQPLALVKRVTSQVPLAPALIHASSASTSHQIPHLIHSSQGPPIVVSKDGLCINTQPRFIETTRTPIFIKSSPNIQFSPVPRHTIMAHTQSTQSIVGGKISAAVKPSLVLNPQPMQQGMMRIPVSGPRMPHGSLHLRHMFPSPRIPLQRNPTQSPPHCAPMRTPPPHRSPKLKALTPPVAHMINRTQPMSIRPPLQHSPISNHRKIIGPRVRPGSSFTQQVRPIIVNTSNNPLVRSGSLLTIPGTPQRIQATLTGIPIQNSQVSLASPNGPMVFTQSKQSSKSIHPSTKLSPSSARPVIFAPRQLLPANFSNQYSVGKQKVLVAVGPHALKRSPTVKIQSKPTTPVPVTSPVRGNVAPIVVTNQSQILVPIRASPVKKTYTGKKRGRKPGSKNKPKPYKDGFKIRIVKGVAQVVNGSKETTKKDPPPEPSPAAASSFQQVSTENEKDLPEEEESLPQNLEVKKTESKKPATEIPRAVVKPQILTHVIDGFIIEESKDPFPMPENSSLPLAVNADGTRTEDQPCGLKRGAEDLWDTTPGYLRCEFCGKMDFPRKFKRSKRFCSMACAKRYNVGCTKRLGLFSPKDEKPERTKHKMKAQGPKAKPLKGARGKYGRLKFNVTQPWNSKSKISYHVIEQSEEGPPSQTTSEESYSNSSSNTTMSPIVSESDSMPFPDDSEELPPGLAGDPCSWSIVDVREFIKSVPGCLDFAEEFHSQEIDGQALMLLKEDHLMTTMSMKLGPALKIISKINTLREKQIQI